ncbi:MAG: hypothetical protein IKD04_03630 [Clostridia bacterium]|nr:hypothetical protein [Clostridia bacterium]
MSDIPENEMTFEDISSSAKPAKRAKKVKKESPVSAYANIGAKNIDKVIKAIAFIVAISILLLFVAVAAVLFLLDDIFMIVSVGLVILGVIVALITLFLIYGLGHIITQNNEILKRL